MKRRGSITVFLSLILTVVLGLEFTLVEIVRSAGLKIQSENVSQIVIENVFSEYNRILWEDYGILAVHMGVSPDNMEKRAEEFMEENENPIATKRSTHFFRLADGNCRMTRYGILTDQNGKAFIRQAAGQMEKELAKDILEKIQKDSLQVQEDMGENINVEEILDRGVTAMEEVKKLEQKGQNKEENETGKEGQTQQEEPVSHEPEIPVTESPLPPGTENPIEVARAYQGTGVLEMVVPPGTQISPKVMSMENCVSNRTLMKGTLQNMDDVAIYEQLLYGQYLLKHYQSFVNPMGHQGMDYELEYIVCGKASDRENLEGIISRLLALREVENYISIIKDPKKMAEAQKLAVAFAGFTQNPPIIKVVELGIVAAWALVESVLDVRLLLTGKKVALVKTTSQWTSDIYQLPACFDVSQKAKECEKGLDYQAYMGALLLVLSEEAVGLRPLDLVEYTLCQNEDYVGAQMDHFVYAVNLECEYKAYPLFYSMVNVTGKKPGEYGYVTKKEMSYL